MILTFLLLVLGFVALIFGADILVAGATTLARKFRVSEAIIGLTIVAFGTSMPEFVVNVSAAIEGSGDIALANVIGSNIFNVLGILGCSALVINPVDASTAKHAFDKAKEKQKFIIYKIKQNLFLEGKKHGS